MSIILDLLCGFAIGYLVREDLHQREERRATERANAVRYSPLRDHVLGQCIGCKRTRWTRAGVCIACSKEAFA